jgi:hypothetical protein
MTAHRLISTIAQEIRQDWKAPFFGAVPYIDAMRELRTMSDKYFADSASSIIRYFLANASTWRGETARRIKAELNLMLKETKS